MSSPFPSSFRPSHTRRNCPPPPAPPGSSNPNLTTYLYHTDTGLVTLTWSRSILGRSLHAHVHNHNPFDSPPPYKALHILEEARIQNPLFHHALHANNPHSLLLKKEHVFADTVYSTTAIFGGKTHRIEIDCGSSRDNDSASSKLSFSVDGDRVLQIKRLKWKFRGNERVESTEGAPELSRRERRSFSRKRRIQKAAKCGVMKSSDKPPKGSNSGTLAAESPVVNNRSDALLCRIWMSKLKVREWLAQGR
ncbi:hypothetical protein HN51_049941 [Arachis hypogaea]